MKKFVLALLAVSVALSVGLAGWVGERAESAFHAGVRRLSEQPEIRVLETGYERGWLHSRGQVSFELRGAVGDAFRRRLVAAGRDDVRARVGIDSVHRVDHGPWPVVDWIRDGAQGLPVLVAVESRVELDQETQSELSAVLGRLPSLLAGTTVRLDGDAETVFSLPARALKPGTVVQDDPLHRLSGQWGGLEGRLHVAAGGAAVEATLSGAGLQLASEGAPGWRVSVGDLAVQLAIARTPGQPWTGSVEPHVASLEWMPASDATGLRFSGIGLRVESRAGASDLRVAVDGSLEGLAAGRSRFGPATARLVVRDVASAALGSLWAARAVGAADPDAPPGRGTAWPALLARQPAVELAELEIATPGGPLRVRASGVALAPSPDAVESGGLAAFRGHVELSAPEPLLAAFLAPGTDVDALAERGLVERADGRVSTRVELDRGVLRVNGVGVDWPAPRETDVAAAR